MPANKYAVKLKAKWYRWEHEGVEKCALDAPIKGSNFVCRLAVLYRKKGEDFWYWIEQAGNDAFKSLNAAKSFVMSKLDVERIK